MLNEQTPIAAVIIIAVVLIAVCIWPDPKDPFKIDDEEDKL